MTHDTTDAAAHARAIRRIASHWATFFGPFIHNDNLWYTDTFMDGKDAGEIGSDMTEVDRHLAALDAARIAAEQRAEEAEARAVWNKRYAEALEDNIEADYGGDDTVEVIFRMARAKASAAADLDAARIAAEQRADAYEVLVDNIVDYHHERKSALLNALHDPGANSAYLKLLSRATKLRSKVHGDLDAEPAPARAEGGDA